MILDQNELNKESSLYLQQHATNPVHWKSYSKDAFEKAEKEGKMVLVSIGYSACHWCHVMEKESFEDQEVADYLNQYFICIKVDREERPDVDHIYMTAVQLMTQKGGWPLNCFTLADGRPIYGGTYFPKEQFLHLLRSLVHTRNHDPEKVMQYAKNLKEGIDQADLLAVSKEKPQFSIEKIDEMVLRWKKRMDRQEGGPNAAPKFPLPNNYLFLWKYAGQYHDDFVDDYVLLTADKIQRGGIYDQIGGGFARYSVDVLWKVPHFEKMLYDNGQLLQLYATLFKDTNHLEYRFILEQTMTWLDREMLSEAHGLYSAQDADSEGEEGKYYCWNPESMKASIDRHADLILSYFNMNKRGYWEEDKYIPLRTMGDRRFSREHEVDLNEFIQIKKEAIEDLLLARLKRIKPVTDQKQLSSWNALTLTGLIETQRVLEDEQSLRLMRRIYVFLRDQMYRGKGKGLYRNFNQGKASISGFLDDYAFVIEACIEYYCQQGDTEALELAVDLTVYAIQHFSHENETFFYFAEESEELISRTQEMNDNVQPSSNSTMARNLYKLGILLGKPVWVSRAKIMLHSIQDGMEHYGSGYSNWGLLYLDLLKEPVQIYIEGVKFKEIASRIQAITKGKAWIHGTENGSMEFFPDKKTDRPLSIFICHHQTCSLSLHSLEEFEQTWTANYLTNH